VSLEAKLENDFTVSGFFGEFAATAPGIWKHP
jgi:hypothetical protein